MWAKLLLALFCQIGMSWSHQLRPSDIGGSMNVYQPTKFNDFYMRVIRNEDFIDKPFSEKDKVEIFKKNFQVESYDPKPIRPNFEYTGIGARTIEVCPTLEKLFEAYFRAIDVERVPDHWNLFTASFTPDDTSKRFGFPKQYATRDYGYVLIKTSIIQHESRISHLGLTFNDNVQNDLDKIQENDVHKIFDFVRKYGTHFISSYATGGLLYQVFVYNRTTFAEVDEALRIRSIPLGDIEELNESQRKFFSSLYASKIGRIQSADANSTIEGWARSVCGQYDHPYSYYNLLKLHDNSSALVEFQDYAQNNVLVKLKLMSNAHFMNLENHRTWFLHALDENYYMLYTPRDYYYHPVAHTEVKPRRPMRTKPQCKCSCACKVNGFTEVVRGDLA